MNVIDAMGVADLPRPMPIMHPATGKPIVSTDGKPALVMVWALNSTVGEQLTREEFDRARALGRLAASSASFDAVREAQRKATAGLIAGWRLVNPVTGEVQDYHYSPARARELMNSPRTDWLRRQIDAFASNDGNFLTAEGSADV